MGGRHAQPGSYIRGPTTATARSTNRCGRLRRRQGPWSCLPQPWLISFLLCLHSVNGGRTPAVPSAVAEGPTFRHAGSRVADTQGPATIRAGSRHRRPGPWHQPSPDGLVGPSAYGRGQWQRRRTERASNLAMHRGFVDRIPGDRRMRTTSDVVAWDPRRMKADRQRSPADAWCGFCPSRG